MTAEVNHTGSAGMKYDGGKPRPGLLFKYAMAGIRGVIAVLEFGAKKYAPGSWVTVPNGEERYFEAAQRHFMDIQEHGLTHADDESGLLSLDHLLCDLLFVRQLVANRETQEEEVPVAVPTIEQELKLYKDLLGDAHERLTFTQHQMYWHLVASKCGLSDAFWNNMTTFGRHKRVMSELYKEKVQ